VKRGEIIAVFGTMSGTTVTANEVVIAGSLGHGLFGFGRRHHSGHRFGGFGFGFGWGRRHPARCLVSFALLRIRDLVRDEG
jgi:hypothetical protein